MLPSLLVCMPVRGQATAGAAARAILADHPAARVLVYHNFVEEPLSAVRNDLAHLPEGVDLVEERVSAALTIGALRNRAAKLGLARHKPFAIASADADITGFMRAGYYGRALEALHDWRATATRRYLELEGLEGNVNLLLLAILSNAQSYVRSRLGLATTMVGAGSLFRAEGFPGYPDLALGEDLAMAERCERVLTLHDEGVYCDCRKQLSNLDEHYDHWPELVNLPAGPVPPADQLIEGGLAFMSAWINTMFRGARSPEMQRRALVFHEQMQILAMRLPGLSPGERLERVNEFRRSPLGSRPPAILT